VKPSALISLARRCRHVGRAAALGLFLRLVGGRGLRSGAQQVGQRGAQAKGQDRQQDTSITTGHGAAAACEAASR
jgi:hypothetical protein